MKLPIGITALLAGLVVALAGSFADNALGDGGLVTVLQLLLWAGGGTLMLAGAASTVALRAGQRGRRARHPRGLRPTHR